MLATRRPPRPATLKSKTFPAPVGGLNTVSPASSMPDTDCPVAWNVIGSEQGCRTRNGYMEWVTGLLGAADNTVRTVIPYSGSKQDGTLDKLFAVTSKGIFDATVSTGAPGAALITFGTQTGNAGYGTWWFMSNAGTRNVIYVDEENGYYLYTEGVGWAQVTNGAGGTQINPPGDATQYVGGTFFKQRNWFVRKNSTIADYLGIGAVAGAATSFDFGSKFKAGGFLTNLYNWSYDGGSGMANYLVAVSSAGDIVIYDGLNPNDATNFYIRGVWQTAGVPYGRRIATDFGGDGLILTTTGILPLSKLVVGNPIVDRTVYSTVKIANLFAQLVQQSYGLKGWSLRFHPGDGALIVTVPQADGQATQQLAMSLSTKGWARYRGLPILSAETWHGQLYFGTADGRVCIATGYVDNQLRNAPQTFNTVDWSIVTKAEKSVLNRIIRHIQPTILAGENPLVNAAGRVNYDQSECPVPIGAPGRGGGAAFDSARFDVDVFAGDFVTFQPMVGAAGRGKSIGAAIRGAAYQRTIFAGVDVLYDEGGAF